jgi:Flp pilus assembly protein TadD
VRLDPKNVSAYSNRAGAYNATRDYRRAIADFSEVIRLNPASAAAYTGRGNAYNAIGEVDRADADFAQAKRLGANGR